MSENNPNSGAGVVLRIAKIRPLPLRLHAQVPPRFLEGRFHLPAQDKPPKDLLRSGDKIGAEQGLSSKSALWAAHQYPAYGYGWQSRAAVPDCGRRCHLYGMLSAPVLPVVHHGGRPDGGRILGDYCQVWRAFALQAQSVPSETGSARWSRIVERCVQAQASSNECHWLE
jgi:hypothetical protein